MAVASLPVPSRWPSLYGRDVLRLADLSPDDIVQLVQLARDLKQIQKLRIPFEPLKGKPWP